MEKLEILNMKREECVDSKFVVPNRVTFEQNGVIRKWDYIKAHDAVAILLFNTTRQAFVIVKQFRPALFMNANRKACGEKASDIIPDKGSDIELKAPFEKGVSYELCAGIVDQTRDLIDIAKSEIMEETGYDVSIDKIETLFEHHSMGYAGNCVTVFYAEVTDDMLKHNGGGNQDEGEFIDVVYLPLDEAKSFIFNDAYPKPSSFIAAFCCYFLKHGITL